MQSKEIELSSLELEVTMYNVIKSDQLITPQGILWLWKKGPHGPKAIGSNLLALLIRTQISTGGYLFLIILELLC
jgi:hypothetical protein